MLVIIFKRVTWLFLSRRATIIHDLHGLVGLEIVANCVDGEVHEEYWGLLSFLSQFILFVAYGGNVFMD